MLPGPSWAQGESTLLVNVTPTQDILPPQVGDYKANPGKYFSVTLTNTTGEEIQTYLTVQIMQTLQSDGTTPGALSLSSPPTHMPGSPLVLPPNGSIDLSMEQMRRIFDHIPLSEMQFSADLFSSFGAADYGLLPEGHYKALLTAYKWDPLLINNNTGTVDSPVALSNPTTTGSALFQVCYRAQAPQFLQPTPALGTTQAYDLQAVPLPLINPTFSWTEPVMNCWRDIEPLYQYTLTVYEVLRMGDIRQSPDEALTNPYLFRLQGITSPSAILSYSAVNKLLDGHVYIAQVQATPIGLTDLNFALVNNQGKSQVLIFTPQMTADDSDLTDPSDDSDNPHNPDNPDDQEDQDDLLISEITTEIGQGDSLYVFRNPEIVKPDFDGNTNNTLFAGNTLNSQWKQPLLAGGEGQQADTLHFRYRVQIYGLSGYATKELALQQEPLYEGYAKGVLKDNPTSQTQKITSSLTHDISSKEEAEKAISKYEQAIAELQELAKLLERKETATTTTPSSSKKTSLGEKTIKKLAEPRGPANKSFVRKKRTNLKKT